MSRKRVMRGINGVERNDGHEPPALTEPKSPPSRWWRKHYECKRNRGKHTFEIGKLLCGHGWRLRGSTWMRDENGWSWRNADIPYWVVWECTACRKQETEFHVPNKKFDRYRHTTWDTNQ